MTVDELIALLAAYPKDWKVQLSSNEPATLTVENPDNDTADVIMEIGW